MLSHSLAAMFLQLAAPAAISEKSEPCPKQMLPPAIDSVGKAAIGRTTVEFSAEPSFETSAWVIRLSDRGPGGGVLEFVRLERQRTCNRYDVAARWSYDISQDEYSQLASETAKLAIPPPSVFIPHAGNHVRTIITDGTNIETRLKNSEWETRHKTKIGKPDGTALSAMFLALVRRYVPTGSAPDSNWHSPVN